MSGKLLLIYICNFHVLSNLLLIYICKLHWNSSDVSAANFKLLSKTLRKVNIKLTKSDIANLVTESSGAAASLVMILKRALENKVD